MARWVCEACGSPWAPGAPCCPWCRSANHIEDAEAEDVTLKTNRQGIVTDSAAVASDTVVLEDAAPEIAEPEAKEAVPAPETAPAGPPAPAPPARVPAAPPRRTPPTKASGG